MGFGEHAIAKKPGLWDSHLSSMVTRKALRVTVLTLFSTFVVQAQNRSPTSVDLLASIAESAFKATRCPGLSVAVAKNNVMVYSAALGFADIEERVADSAHRLASLSKPVTGTIIMDLVQSGRLKLDTPIKTYLPEEVLIGAVCARDCEGCSLTKVRLFFQPI